MANEDKSRWFLVLRLKQDGEDRLSKLLQIANETAAEYGQPLLYAHSSHVRMNDREEMRSARPAHKTNSRRSAPQPLQASSAAVSKDRPSDDFGFHISIAWTLEAPSESMLAKVEETATGFDPFKVEISSVKVKMGNGIHVVPLTEARESCSGIYSN